MIISFKWIISTNIYIINNSKKPVEIRQIIKDANSFRITFIVQLELPNTFSLFEKKATTIVINHANKVLNNTFRHIWCAKTQYRVIFINVVTTPQNKYKHICLSLIIIILSCVPKVSQTIFMVPKVLKKSLNPYKKFL